MPKPIERIKLKGFKSIKEMDLELHNINILIGANGSGKSNLISFFKLLNAINAIQTNPLSKKIDMSELNNYVNKSSGADELLFFGPKTTDRIEIQICSDFQLGLGSIIDKFYLTPNSSNLFSFSNTETNDIEIKRQDAFHCTQLNANIYNLSDTSENSSIRLKNPDIDENDELKSDGSNFVSMLYRYQNRDHELYHSILSRIRLIAPYIKDFIIKPNPLNPIKLKFQWKHVVNDHIFGRKDLSDGTLRFLVLAILLCKAGLGIDIVIIEEPELGLHPLAIKILSELIKSASTSAQIIISTQSAELVSNFEPEDIIVTEMIEGASVFNRLNKADLDDWLQDYSLGELWNKNVFGGRP